MKSTLNSSVGFQPHQGPQHSAGCASVIFDIDGTLANGTHRQHHLKPPPKADGSPGKKDWKSFNATMHLDTIHPSIVLLAKLLHEDDYRVILVSGREDIFRDVTTTWLEQHCITYDALYMRPAADYRDDTIVKLELLHQLRADGYAPWLVVEDRNRLVKMWREQGLTCLQCAEGDF